MTGLHEHTWWAPKLHVIIVLTLWLGKQFDELDSELSVKDIVLAIDPRTGFLNLDKLIPYDFEWDPDLGDDIGVVIDTEDVEEKDLPKLVKIYHRYIYDSSVNLKGQNFDATNWKIVNHGSGMACVLQNVHNKKNIVPVGFCRAGLFLASRLVFESGDESLC